MADKKQKAAVNAPVKGSVPIQPENDPMGEMRELLQRTQAQFENYRKQTEKRVIEMEQMASKQIIEQFLPIIDNLELALKNKCDAKDEFVQGIELIYAQLKTLLADNGIETIKTTNELFDPYFHEALMKVESETPENTIVEEFQKGFMLHGHVIRHAKVTISAGKKEQ
ncbi:nucleotide exchange factor GrpE [Candidatus Woesearchaeota archaeon CG10_big_fil_rev_8_21_14_0_10_36_11]|nr:MAG: nucleotide exchange factor GrpE [Candidatus Woesearchaeota archaeon CG10_big_fil_rev_8_21_14_0_10_36_11]